MSEPTPVEYTTEEGGDWISGLATFFWSSLSEKSFEEQCAAWSRYQAEKVDPDRRIPILLEEIPGIVTAAAVKLPSGRVLDAVLGCFRDETEKIRRLKGPPMSEDAKTTVEAWKTVGMHTNIMMELDDRPEPIRETSLQQEFYRVQLSVQDRVLKARHAAIRRGLYVLFDRGIIEDHPKDISLRASKEVEDLAEQLPADLLDLFADRRLKMVVDGSFIAMSGLHDRGHIVFDGEVIADWEVRLSKP